MVELLETDIACRE